MGLNDDRSTLLTFISGTVKEERNLFLDRFEIGASNLVMVQIFIEIIHLLYPKHGFQRSH